MNQNNEENPYEYHEVSEKNSDVAWDKFEEIDSENDYAVLYGNNWRWPQSKWIKCKFILNETGLKVEFEDGEVFTFEKNTELKLSFAYENLKFAPEGESTRSILPYTNDQSRPKVLETAKILAWANGNEENDHNENVKKEIERVVTRSYIPTMCLYILVAFSCGGGFVLFYWPLWYITSPIALAFPITGLYLMFRSNPFGFYVMIFMSFSMWIFWTVVAGSMYVVSFDSFDNSKAKFEFALASIALVWGFANHFFPMIYFILEHRSISRMKRMFDNFRGRSRTDTDLER